jgi:hypothetical protein
MVRRPGDNSPEPPGGRAAERLRTFEESRRPQPVPAEDEPEPKEGKGSNPDLAGRSGDAERRRRKD